MLDLRSHQAVSFRPNLPYATWLSRCGDLYLYYTARSMFCCDYDWDAGFARRLTVPEAVHEALGDRQEPEFYDLKGYPIYAG